MSTIIKKLNKKKHIKLNEYWALYSYDYFYITANL